MNYTIVELSDIVVGFVKADSPTKANDAFNQLESKMTSLNGKKFYGVFYSNTGEYRACVKLDGNESDPKGVGTDRIPGGRYARTKIEDWIGKESTIGSTFDSLAEDCARSGYRIDSNRPSVECYRSQKELFLLLPII